MALTKFTEKLISDSFKASISGSDTTESSSFASRITLVEGGTTSKTLVSSSAQIATDISGSFNSTSSSLASRVTVNEGRVNQGVKTTDSPTFAGGTVTGDFTVGGTLTAQEVHTEFESASILFTSGSTIFGNSSDDVHEFKGNKISGSSTSTASLAVISLADKIEHIGDTNNTIQFDTDQIKLRTGGSSRLIARDSNVELYNDLVVAGAATFNEDSGDKDFRVESNANVNMLFVDGGQNAVGIGTNNAGANSEKLLIVGNDNVNFLVVSSSNDDNFISMGTFENDQAIIGFGNKATTPTALNFYAANRPPMGGSNLVMSLSGSGNVGIGTAIPTSLLTIHAGTSNDGDVTVLRLNNDETALADGDGVSMMFGLGTDFRDVGKIGVFASDNSHDQYNMRFSVRNAANTLTEYMRIKGDNGNITTVTGSALSYQSNGSTSAPSATTPVVFTQPSASLVQIDDSNNRYKKMFSQQVAKSGTARIKFTARNVSGTYWWSWLISRNNGSGSIDVESPTPMKLHNGNDAASSYAGGLAHGESSSVHVFRKFDITVKDVVAGDFIELWMRSSDSGGGQVTGNGQDLLAKDFQILSTTPSIESNAILPGTPKGQGLWEIIDKVVLTSNTSILSHPTCFANGSKYSHFKIVVGWLGTTAQESIFMRFLYNGGSSAYSAADYYNTKVQTESDTTSLNVEIQNATSHIDLFNQTNTSNIGGVHGEIKIYNISAPIIRNGHGTRLQDVDTNRGTAYRAIGRSVLFGYDDQNDSYGQQVTSFRWNTSEDANNTITGYSGFQMFPGSGNFYAQSYVIICGFRVDDEYTLGTTDI